MGTTGSHPSSANKNKRARDPQKKLLVVTLVVLTIINAHATRKKKLLVVTLVMLIIINAHATRKKLLVVTLVVLIIINAHATRKKYTGSHPRSANNNKRARDPEKKPTGSHPSS